MKDYGGVQIGNLIVLYHYEKPDTNTCILQKWIRKEEPCLGQTFQIVSKGNSEQLYKFVSEVHETKVDNPLLQYGERETRKKMPIFDDIPESLNSEHII